MIDRAKLAELRKSVSAEFKMISDSARPPNMYRMGDFLDTIEALWKENAELKYAYNEAYRIANECLERESRSRSAGGGTRIECPSREALEALWEEESK